MTQRSLLSLASLVVAGVLAAPPTAAQCSPWSKWGMHRLAWSPGSELTVGSVAHGGAAIALEFAYDAEAGVVLRLIRHRGQRKDGTVTLFDYVTDPPPGTPRSLWQAVFRHVEFDEPVILRPEQVPNFEVWADHPQNARVAVFRWSGLDLPAGCSCDSRFWMELRVEVPANDPARSNWHSRLGRIQRPGGTERYTLDEVHAPIVHTRQPGDGLFARLLVPFAGRTTLPDTNLPMRLWSALGLSVELEHPARGQQLQCSAIYSGQIGDVPQGDHVLSAFRKILYFTTEDTEGWYKKFSHSVVANPSNPAELYYRWAPLYFPPYGPTPWINFHDAPYGVTIAALEAETDAYWYDVTRHYREFVDRTMRLTPTSSRLYRGNPDFIDASVFVATSAIGHVVPNPETMFDTFIDQALLFREAFPGADGQESPMFMEWQRWLKGDPNDAPFPGRQPEDPIGPEFNPAPFSGQEVALREPPVYVREQIARGHAAGLNMSVYTLPLQMNRSVWPSFREEWFLFDRDGSKIKAPTGFIVDYGNLAVPLWFSTVFYGDVFDSVPGLNGAFFDVLSGGGAFLRYPFDPDKLFKMRRYHGGKSYVRGTQILFDLVRARLLLRRPGRTSHPDLPFLASETVQEFLAGRYDFAQHGYKPVPMQMQFNRLFDVLSGVPSLAADTSNPSPPLWNAVYHEWSRAEGLTVPLTVLAVNSLLGGGQDNPAFPGVTWQRWGDYMRYVHALWFQNGMKPTSFQYLFGLEPWNLFVERDGHVDVRDPSQVQQQQLVDFLTRMHQALDRYDEAGRFLAYGRMERPLQLVDGYNPVSVLQSIVPSADIAAATDPAKPGVLHFYEDFFSTQPYPVPHVGHSVWRSADRDGKLGIVFVNWSDQPSWWHGVLDPACYEGLGESFVLKGLRPVGGGVEEYLIGQGSGPTEIAWNPGATGIRLQHHAAAGPDFMPPRSVQVVLIEPAP